jgi:uncharacterized protein (DUF1810 family)
MPSNLERFLIAQEKAYTVALDELLVGKKATHWMWFIFPQLVGLGRSEMAAKYGIRGLIEARDYLSHEVLGPRLNECTRAVVESGVAPIKVFGQVDYLKFVSSMTLFSVAADSPSLFSAVLARTSGPDRCTLTLLGELP